LGYTPAVSVKKDAIAKNLTASKSTASAIILGSSALKLVSVNLAKTGITKTIIRVRMKMKMKK
jgi:hypothetical protein